jgi:hypothetical protein
MTEVKIELPVSDETAQRVLVLLNDPDTSATVEVAFGSEKALGRWYVFAVRRESGDHGGFDCYVSLAWAGM